MVKVLRGGELIANNYLEEKAYFIFLLSVAPHFLLSPAFNVLDIYLKDKNYILVYRGFGVSSLDVALNQGTWLYKGLHEVSSKCSLYFRVKYSKLVL